MISKDKFIEIYLSKADFDVKDIAKMVTLAEKAYDQLVHSTDSGDHSKSAHILMEVYHRKKTYLEGLGNKVNPVFAKEETDALRSIWDTFHFLLTITNQNRDSKIEWGIGKRP